MSETVDKLEKLKNDLRDAEANINITSKNRDSLKSDITYLEKKVGEVNQFVNSYNKAYGSSKISIDELNAYITAKLKDINKVLKTEKKAELDNIRKGLNNDTQAIIEKVKGCTEELEKYEGEFIARQNEFNSIQKQFDSMRVYESDISSKILILKKMRDSIERPENEDQLLKTYILITDLEEKLTKEDDGKEFKLKSTEDFKNELEKKWSDLSNKKEETRSIEEKKRTAKNNLEKFQIMLDEKKAKRETEISEEIKALEGQ